MPATEPKSPHRFAVSASAMAMSLVLAAMTGGPAQAAGPKADLILTRGVVIPMTGPEKRFEAIAVRDGRILALGRAADIDALRGPSTKVVDLQGKAVLPGFIDAHGHISGVAQQTAAASLQPPPVGATADIPTLLRQMSEFAKTTNEGWIVGFGYDDAELAERRHPTRHELDGISADRPVIAIHASGHLGALNTRALELTGMLHAEKDPEGGKIAREADGTAAGPVEETALAKAMALLPAPTLDQSIEQLRRAEDIYAANGITTAQDGGTVPGYWPILQEAARRGALKLDVDAVPMIAQKWPAIETLPIGQPRADRLRVVGIKIVLDGSPQGRTAWLSQPYFHPPHNQPADYVGYRRMSDAQLDSYLQVAARHGWQVFVHVNGDAAIQQLIDGVRRVNAASPQPLRRTIAIHAQTARSDQLREMKALDIEPSFFASHTYFWGDWHRQEVLGPARADRISPQRESIDLGLRPTIHNDSPVVPPNILRLVWSAATRQTRSDYVLGPAQRITHYEALQEVTTNAAYELHEEQIKGTLEVGKLADFVVLDGDPLAVSSEKLLNLQVRATIKEGVVVWQAPAEPAVAAR